MPQTTVSRFKYIYYGMLTCKWLPAFSRTKCLMFRVKQSTSLGLHNPEEGSATSFRNFGNYLPTDTV
jgi:hypothetical protein